MGDQLTLRPVGEDDLAVMQRLTSDPESTGEYAWFGWLEPGRLHRRWAETGMLADDGGILMISCDDDPVGFVAWRRRATARTSHCWDLGIAVRPEASGRGIGTRAHQLIVEYLFAHTTVHRIEATTETGNLAEQRALEKAGFIREGIARGTTWRNGAWHDTVTYSRLRTD